MSGRSRSSLFLMEQLIVITIFAVCASVCVKIFIGSFLMANDTRDMNHALVAAKNCAECYKVYADLEKTAAVLSGRECSLDGAQAVAVYYDKKWKVCDLTEAAYALRLNAPPLNASSPGAAAGDIAGLPLLCELSVEKITGEEIVGFTVAARRMHAVSAHMRRGAE